jgi:plastocyanin
VEPAQPDTQGTGTRVTLSAVCFSPTQLYVQPGATVTWTKEDGMRQVVAGSFSARGVPTTLEAGQSTMHTFPTPGIFALVQPAAAGALGYGLGRRRAVTRP